MYLINEIFESLQGEGFHTGTPAVFVRFSGCNLRCRFCDTRHQQGTRLSLEEIIAEVNRYAAPLIILTGGEPSLYIDEKFVAELKRHTGKRIAIETNGTRPLPTNIDWVTLSPKSGFAGGDIEPCVLNRCDELKVVHMGQNLSQYNNIETLNRFLQPCYCDNADERQRNLRACIEAVMTHNGWRLSLQIHRILGIR
ncbi:MAG: radical SAM protein [Bacteroidales bacterium]|nr:radical SAM protein [Bacteroidales bacterium]